MSAYRCPLCHEPGAEAVTPRAAVVHNALVANKAAYDALCERLEEEF